MLYVALHASFEGLNPSDYYPCDAYIRHMQSESLAHPNLKTDYEEIELDEAEYKEVWKDKHPDDIIARCTVQGIARITEVFSYLAHIDAIFENCETMGVLGGPLAYWAPDMRFFIESRLIVSTISITPVWKGKEGYSPLTNPSWNRLRKLFAKHDPWTIAHMGALS